MKKMLTCVLAVLIVLSAVTCAMTVSVNAAAVSLSYSFSGNNKNDNGYAQGTVTLTVSDSSSGGTFYLYWSDDTGAIDGYDKIATLNVSSGSSSHTMPEHTAIPADATKLIAVKSQTNKTVSSASAVYSVPVSKQLSQTSEAKLYSFAAFSDIHICEGGNTGYPYDEQHLQSAFKTAALRNVDFVVTSGDNINNQRTDAGTNTYYPAEWNKFLKILSDSDYVNPIYEAIGNHELWNGDTESNYNNKDWTVGSKYFAKSTGLDSTVEALSSGKSYYEITEPVTGDHFLFMALEGGFYPDRVNEFSDAQLSWLESKLRAYENDGKNCFILEHCNFYKWGSGDSLTNPQYNIPLKDSMPSTQKLEALLKTYKNAVMITGHTHFRFTQQFNYSDNNNTSSVIMHNSSVGGVRQIVNGSRDNSTQQLLDLTEGYIVEVYKDCTVFNGTNLYYNLADPNCTYIVDTTTSAQNPSPTQVPTQAPTQAPTKAPTQVPTQPPTQAPTEPQKPLLPGDVDEDGKVTILDATTIQLYLIRERYFDSRQIEAAKVSGDDEVSIIDATNIQRYLAQFVTQLPVPKKQSPAVTSANDMAALKSAAKENLSKYYLYASYNQYQALKKYVKELDRSGDVSQTACDALSAKNASLLDIVTKTGGVVGDTINVYFTDALNWGTVSAYYWGASGDNSWPGTAMTFVETNSMGQKVYKISIPSGKYTNIIFNKGSNAAQTVDLPLENTNNQGFYTTSTMSSGKYTCGTYTYGQ